MLARGLSLLTILAENPDGLTLTALAHRAQLPVSTVHRLLATHIKFGFVHQEATTHAYVLGIKIFELSSSANIINNISDVALGQMQRLSAAIDETTLLAVYDDAEVVFIQRADSGRAITIEGRIGQRGPAYCTSNGKVLLADLTEHELDRAFRVMQFKQWTPNTITEPARLRAEIAETRANGYAVADEEYDEGIVALAVPVTDHRSATRASLCISAPKFRTSITQLFEHLPSLKDAAGEIGLRIPMKGTLAVRSTPDGTGFVPAK